MRIPGVLLLSCVSLLKVGGAGDAQDPVLVVERARDLPGRDALWKTLLRRRIDLRLEDAGPGTVATLLERALAGRVPFLVRPRDGDRDFARWTLRIERLPAARVLALLEGLAPVRFVYRAGAVFVAHEDSVAEWMPLAIYDVRAATAPLRDPPPPPRLGLGPPRELERGEMTGGSEPRTLSGLTAERLVELVRNAVRPESWERGASILESGGLLFVRQTERGHRRIRTVLARLGVGGPLRAHGRPARSQLARKRSRHR